MGMYTFTGPDGRAYDVNGPQGSTKEQAFSMLQGHLTQQPAATLKTAARPPVPAATTAGTTTTPPPAASGAAPPPTTPPPPPGTTPPPATTPPPPNTTTPPPVDYSPSYENYLKVRQSQDQSQFSESGTANLGPLITQEQWNSMSLKDRVNAVTNSANVYAILPGDPRYDALAQQTGAEPGRGIIITSNVPHQGDPKFWVDPSKVIALSDGEFAYAPNNQTPAAQAEANSTTLAGKIIWGLTGAAFGYGAYSAFADAGALAGASAGTGAVAPGMEAQAALESQLLNAGIVPGSAEWTSALTAAGLDPTAGAALPDPAAGDPGGLDLSPLPTTPPGSVTPLIDGPPGGLLDGLDLSPIGTTPAGSITPLFSGPFDPAAAADALTPSLTYDINNYPAGPDSFMPPDTPPPDFTLQPPPEIPGTDLMPAIPGSSFLDGLTTPGNLLKAGGLAATLFSATRKPTIPDALKNNTTTQDNKPILDQARQILQANGQPTPDQKGGIDAIIDRQIREAKAAITQRAINSGMGADSMVTQQQINTMTENANGLRAQLYMQQAQQNINNALKEWGMANEQDLAVQKLIAEYELQADKDSQALAANIAKAFGWLSSVSGD